MLTIHTNTTFRPEKDYLFSAIFGEFLGVPYRVVFEERSDYLIVLPDEAQLLIADHFFANIQDLPHYIDSCSVPKTVQWLSTSLLPEVTIPVLWGTPAITVLQKHVACDADLFALVFFMLTRWEELHQLPMDIHGRVMGSNSTAFLHGFLDHPVVDETVEAIWAFLLHLGYETKRKLDAFELVPTHDIDRLRFFSLRMFGGDLLKRRAPSMAIRRLLHTFASRNRANTFEFLMDVSEQYGVKSRFYFLNGGTTQYDNFFSINDPWASSILDQISSRNHVIGIHPSYSSHLDRQQWEKERNSLQDKIGLPIIEGRQHYLRFTLPDTWALWNECDMKVDSTMGYFDYEGFRCGTSRQFQVYDVRARKQLQLSERPLIIMECSLAEYQSLNLEESRQVYYRYIDIAKKYQTPLTILFHNTSFDPVMWKGWAGLYEDIFAYAYSK